MLAMKRSGLFLLSSGAASACLILLFQSTVFAQGDNSCLGTNACRDNTGAVADNSCQGTQACQVNDGAIAAGACIGDRACLNNPDDIGPGECVGPPVAGVGVCEVV